MGDSKIKYRYQAGSTARYRYFFIAQNQKCDGVLREA